MTEATPPVASIKSKRVALKYIFINLLTIIAILSHEGFAVFFVPMIFAVLLITEKKLIRPAGAYLLPSFTVWLFTVLFGAADVPLEQFMQMLNSNAVTSGIYPFDPSQVNMVYYMTIAEKVSFTFEYYNNTKIAQIILTFLLLSPSIICMAGYWRMLIKNSKSPKEKHRLIFFALAALSPLISMVFAIDTYRWIGWALFNSSAALIIMFYLDESYRNIIIAYTKKNTVIIIFAIVVALLLGYFTVFSPYPIIEDYFPALYSFFFG